MSIHYTNNKAANAAKKPTDPELTPCGTAPAVTIDWVAEVVSAPVAINVELLPTIDDGDAVIRAIVEDEVDVIATVPEQMQGAVTVTVTAPPVAVSVATRVSATLVAVETATVVVFAKLEATCFAVVPTLVIAAVVEVAAEDSATALLLAELLPAFLHLSAVNWVASLVRVSTMSPDRDLAMLWTASGTCLTTPSTRLWAAAPTSWTAVLTTVHRLACSNADFLDARSWTSVVAAGPSGAITACRPSASVSEMDPPDSAVTPDVRLETSACASDCNLVISPPSKALTDVSSWVMAAETWATTEVTDARSRATLVGGSACTGSATTPAAARARLKNAEFFILW